MSDRGATGGVARLVHFMAGVPNRGHQALADLERARRLHALVTQNIDGLHQRAGNSPGMVIEVHGTVLEYMCMSCDARGPMQKVLDRVRAGEDDPPCTDCNGILKSATISFGQALVPEVIDRAMDVSGEADLFLAIGSTLQVFPVAGTVARARAAGARIVIVNAEPTGFDEVADVVFRERIGDVLPALCDGGSLNTNRSQKIKFKISLPPGLLIFCSFSSTQVTPSS
jgi:NAD-dependent deacetylase